MGENNEKLWEKELEKGKNVVYIWKKVCWKCGEVVVVLFNHLEFGDRFSGTGGNLDQAKLKNIANEYKVKYGLKFSHTVQGSYEASICTHCDALQGDFYLMEDFFELAHEPRFYENCCVYDENNSPSERELKKIKFYNI